MLDRIGGQAWTVRALFGRRYLLDVYQREYQWEKIHLQDLINDLARRYLAQKRPEHELQDVATFEPYFLGPIVTHKRMDQTFIVDGQQRLTTIMLLLIWLYRLQSDRDDAVPGLRTLVVSDHFGKPVFAVEDPVLARGALLSALLDGEEPKLNRALSTSEANIAKRFGEIDELFPIDLQDDDLPFFVYWLLDRVLLVEIFTDDDRLALETFETMNDRGLRLNAADLLKSFLLQHATPANRAQISQLWRARTTKLTETDSNGHTTFMKSWLRAKYSRHAADDDAIGRGFDRWLRAGHEEFGLRYPGDFSNFVLHQMDRLSKRYLTLLSAARRPHAGLDSVYFNGLNSVTLQFPLILATVTPDDDDNAFITKAHLAAGYLDIVVARRMVSGQDYRYDALSNGIFALAREIRGMDTTSLAQRLGHEVAAIPEEFDGVTSYALRYGNRAKTKYLLSRLTAWMQVQVDPNPNPPSHAEAVQRLRAHEIEHVWANRPEYQPQVAARRFQAVRNRLGALVLLTKDVNSSVGDKPYDEKVQSYIAQNILARSLHPECYQNNPRFIRLLESHKLSFQSVEVFDEAMIDQRQRLYRRLCEIVWNPERYGLVLPKRAPQPKSTDKTRITVGRLLELGLVQPGSQLVAMHRGTQYRAQLTVNGQFITESGETFGSPSAAAAAVLDRPSWTGWTFWRVVQPDGTTVRLDAIRKTATQGQTVGETESS